MSKKNATMITAEPGKSEVIITREFNAPREQVFKAFTEKNLVNEWLVPNDLKMTIEKFQPQSGGSYRYIHTDNKGQSFAFHGVFHEVTFPERIIQTFEYEGEEKGHVALETIRFDALSDNRTRIITQSVFQSVADRDRMIESGMEQGVQETHQKLDELLQKELV